MHSTHGKSWFIEGQTLSKIINTFPGANAVAGLHDAWGRYDWLYEHTLINAIGAIAIAYTHLYTKYYYVF
jgi:hypothetical protein